MWFSFNWPTFLRT